MREGQAARGCRRRVRFFFSSRRRHTRFDCDWSSDVCSSDLFDIQAGRVPPTFGAFARRAYVSDNFLIGYPLAYQYLTSLRPDAVPANADELLRSEERRVGKEWRSRWSPDY